MNVTPDLSSVFWLGVLVGAGVATVAIVVSMALAVLREEIKRRRYGRR